MLPTSSGRRILFRGERDSASAIVQRGQPTRGKERKASRLVIGASRGSRRAVTPSDSMSYPLRGFLPSLTIARMYAGGSAPAALRSVQAEHRAAGLGPSLFHHGRNYTDRRRPTSWSQTYTDVPSGPADGTERRGMRAANVVERAFFST